MDYYINTEIAEKFQISSTTVLRWIENALIKKNNLKVEIRNKKPRILVNEHNESEMKRLAEESVKYRNNVSLSKPRISELFHKLFDKNEQISIINDLKNQRETRIKWTYKGEGADIWDKRYNSNVSPLKSSVDVMLKNSISDIINYIGKHSVLNFFDIGCGTGQPLLNPIKTLSENFKINYTALDISLDVLKIAKENFKEWLPSLKFSEFQIDFETTSLEPIIFDKWINNQESKNIIFCLGNTICNIDNRIQALKNIRYGLQKGDIFILSFGLDSGTNRSKLKYVQDPIVYALQTQTLKLLGINIDSCEPDVFYDEVKRAKIKTLKLDQDYQISFRQGIEVNLKKSEKIIIWKHHLLDLNKIIDELGSNGFIVRNIKTDSDQSNALVICEI